MKPPATTRSNRATNSPRKHLPLSIAAATVLIVNIVLLTQPQADQEAIAAGTLRVALADDAVLDPHRGGLPASWLVSRAIHRGLYAFPYTSEGTEPVLDLALDFPEQVSSGVYEIAVRPAVFSSGAALDLDDVAASLMRLKRTGIGVSRFLAPIEKIRVVGDIANQRVRIVASRPMPELAWILAHPQAAILPSSTPTRVGVSGPAGLGPYRVESRALQREMVLRRNTNWTPASDSVRSAPADRITFTVYQSGPAALAAVNAGAANMIGDPGPPDMYPRTIPTRAGGRCARLLAIDRGAPGLDNLGVRKRIQNALQNMDLSTGSTRPALGILPQQILGTRSDAATTSGGNKPKRALELAGSDTPRDRREIAELAAVLNNAGVKVTTRLRPAGLHARLINAPSAQRPDLVLFTWCAEWPGLAGRAFFDVLTGPGRIVPRTQAISEKLNAAWRASGSRAQSAWAAVENAVFDTATLIPVGWPAEIAAFFDVTVPQPAAAMWPQGDPANMAPAP
jgi:MarR-like DNA-binding transcriptional regulator SgrR of sgrS sRNA